MKGSKLTITLCLIKLDRKILSRQVFHDNENCGCKKQNGNCLHFDKILDVIDVNTLFGNLWKNLELRLIRKRLLLRFTDVECYKNGPLNTLCLKRFKNVICFELIFDAS